MPPSDRFFAASRRRASARLARRDPRYWALLPLALTALVYGPLLGNYFRSDDFLNLFQIGNQPLLDYLLTVHGGHVLVTRNALFALCFAAFGTNPVPYFALVLATHLLNVWLFWRILHQLAGSPRLAAFGAALWGTAPVNAGSLGWYAVYGHVVAATAILVVVTQVLDAAAAAGRPSRARRALWYLLALAAVTSFGVGIGLALVLPFVIVLLVPQWRTWSRIPPLATLLAVVPALYFGLTLAHAERPGPVELSALQMQVGMALLAGTDLALMLSHLVGYGCERLVLGYFPLPAHYPGALAYAIAAAFAVATAAVVLRSPGRPRRQMLAAWLLVLGCYGMIAIGRVGFFRSYPTLEVMVAQARYHYVGGLALAMVACIALARAGGWAWVRGPLKQAALLTWVVATLIAYRYSAPFDHNQEARREALGAVHWIRSRIQQTPPGEPVYFVNRIFFGVPPIFVSAYEFPGWAGIFTIFFPDNVVDGRRVFFAEREPTVLEAHREGRRTATLLIPIDQLPGKPAAAAAVKPAPRARTTPTGRPRKP